MAGAKRAAWSWILTTCFFVLPPAGAADSTSEDPHFEKPNFSYKTIKTKEGLVFRVPSDMPIEDRNGIQAPVPFDEYVYGKISNLEARISRLDAKVTRLEEQLKGLNQGAEKPEPPAAPKTQDSGESTILKAGIQ